MAHLAKALRSKTILRCTALLAATGWALGGAALAQDVQTGPIDDKATSILQEMSQYLSTQQTVSFRARTFFDLAQESGIKIKIAREVELMLKRPQQIYASTLDDSGISIWIWFDGSKITAWQRSANEFMTLEYTGTTDDMLDELIGKYDFNIPLADLLYSDLAKSFGEHIISSEYIGVRNVDGVPCHQISFESQGADWQIWIEADATPVPRRFVIDYVTEEGQPQFMAQLDAWSLGGELEDHHFTASMPEGVKRVEFGKATGDQPQQQ
jgi:hypothetical protein